MTNGNRRVQSCLHPPENVFGKCSRLFSFLLLYGILNPLIACFSMEEGAHETVVWLSLLSRQRPGEGRPHHLDYHCMPLSKARYSAAVSAMRGVAIRSTAGSLAKFVNSTVRSMAPVR